MTSYLARRKKKDKKGREKGHTRDGEESISPTDGNADGALEIARYRDLSPSSGQPLKTDVRQCRLRREAEKEVNEGG